MPGTLTTAFLTLRLLLPAELRLRGGAVRPDHRRRGRRASIDAGLIIHEGQLTFQNQGLHLVVDLGVWWQEKTGLPLPLGGNVVRRDLGPTRCGRSAGCSRRASATRWTTATTRWPMPCSYARDMDKALADQFRRHVRQRLDAGLRPARAGAVRRLLEEGHRAGVIPSLGAVEFVE